LKKRGFGTAVVFLLAGVSGVGALSEDRGDDSHFGTGHEGLESWTIHSDSPEGHVHGDECIVDVDRKHLEQGFAQYVKEFGPLSKSSSGMPFFGASTLFPIFPVGATVWDDLRISNFVDLASDPELLDWNCGTRTYDGHDGSDTSILSWDHQLIGVPIVAALDGVVVATHDGEPDMNTEWKGQPANYVTVDHGDGRICYYWHMKQWSVAVSPGQQVSAGEQLGLIASSGNSTGPHLHFETRDSGVVVEPFEGECQPEPSQWVNQIGLMDETIPVDFAVTTQDLTAWYMKNHRRWRPPYENQIPLDHDRVRIWMRGLNLPPESTIRFQFFFPSGAADYDSGEWSFGSDTDYYTSWLGWWTFNLTDMHKTSGTWSVVISVNGEHFLTAPIEVVQTVDPEFNRAPRAINAAFEPASPDVGDVITCRLVTHGPLGDFDWDLVRYRYLWRINGEVVRDEVSAGRADHLPRRSAPPGGLVTCTVTPTDGKLEGGLVTISARLPGGCPDLNNDGHVDGIDLGTVLGSWGSKGGAADLDENGVVDGSDLTLILAAWGPCS
jgi:hypothetical protein